MPRQANSFLHGVLAWRQKLGVRIVAVLIVVSAAFAAIGSWYDYRTEAMAMRDRLLDHGRWLTRQAVLACPDFVIVQMDWPKLAEYVESLVGIDPAIEFAIVQRADGQNIAAFPAGAIPRQTEMTLLLVEPIFADRDKAEIATFYLGLSQEPMLAKLRDRTWRLLLRQGIGFLSIGAVLWLVLRLLVVRPIHGLDEEAQRLGRGELAAPLPDFGVTELGRLGRRMDEMRRNLQQNRVALEDQNQRLLELDRLKSQFLANMSHELRTPLTSIIGGTRLLADPTMALAERVAFAESVERNGRDMLDLVDRLLDLTKLEADKLLIETRICRVAEEVLGGCEALHAKAVQKGLQLHVDLTRVQGVEIESDPTRLRQAVRAIVDNAVKFTDAGTVNVRAEIVEKPQRTLRVVVEDTGPGIPADMLGRDFVPFRQADGSLTRRHGGSGLGLYITQQVARRLGGDLTIARRDGGGTRAEIVVAAKAAVPIEPRARSAGKPRVLVVDDAPDNRHLLKAVLGKLGAAVEVAENGRIAVDRLKASPTERPDLVLMDLQMPELDGLGAIRELRSFGFDGPIVALTAHALADDRQAAMAAGADGYETKPVSMQRLGEIVASHVR